MLKFREQLRQFIFEEHGNCGFPIDERLVHAVEERLRDKIREVITTEEHVGNKARGSSSGKNALLKGTGRSSGGKGGRSPVELAESCCLEPLGLNEEQSALEPLRR